MATSQNPNASAKENVQEFDDKKSGPNQTTDCNQQLDTNQEEDSAGCDSSNTLHTNKDANIKDLPEEDES